MPWVYNLNLTEYRNAKEIKDDWENNIPGNANVVNDYGGVSVFGEKCVIVSERNNPEYEEMEELDYVRDINERKEIQNREDSDFDLPIGLGFGFELKE